MRERRDPWRWPFSICTALLVVVCAVFFIPEAWIDAFFSPLDHAPDEAHGRRSWLEILPPPIVEVTRSPEPEPDPPAVPPAPRPAAADARWWTEGWRIRTVDSVASNPVEARRDSIAVALAMLDLTPSVLDLARPDSVLAARLHLMRIEDGFRFDELKPYLGAMTRANAYRDMMSRAADMYDEFLQSEIMVPD